MKVRKNDTALDQYPQCLTCWQVKATPEKSSADAIRDLRQQLDAALQQLELMKAGSLQTPVNDQRGMTVPDRKDPCSEKEVVAKLTARLRTFWLVAVMVIAASAIYYDV